MFHVLLRISSVAQNHLALAHLISPSPNWVWGDELTQLEVGLLDQESDALTSF